MNINDAIKQFRSGKYKKYVLFYGEDEYLKGTGVKELLKAVDVQTPELNFSVFEERPDAMAVVRALETLPFMSERRVVMIKSTDILTSACSADFSEPLTEAGIPESNILIINLRGKPDRRKALVKLIAKEGMMVECAPLKDRDVISFIIGHAMENNLIISQSNAQLLSEYCGGDLDGITGEISKLSSVCRGNITKADIEKYVSRSVQYSVFKIHDLLCAKDAEGAKRVLDRVLDDDPYPIGIISLIAGNFRQMLVARACKDAGFDDRRIIGCIEEETGAKEWAARRAIANCRPFSAQRLREGIKKLGRLDFNAKHGEVVLQTDLFPILVDIYTT